MRHIILLGCLGILLTLAGCTAFSGVQKSFSDAVNGTQQERMEELNKKKGQS